MKFLLLIFFSFVVYITFPLALNSINGQLEENEIIPNVIESVEKIATGIASSSLDELQDVQQDNKTLTEYKSEPIGVKLQIPAEWKIYQENNKTEDCFGDTITNCKLHMQNNDLFSGVDYTFLISKITKSNMSLVNYLTIQYEDLKRGEGFTLIEDKEIIIDNKQAWMIVYSIISNNERHQIMENIIKVNDTFYSIGYSPIDDSDYSKYIPEVQKVFSSIEFIPSKPPETKEPSFLKHTTLERVPLSELSNITNDDKDTLEARSAYCVIMKINNLIPQEIICDEWVQTEEGFKEIMAFGTQILAWIISSGK